MKKYSLAPYDKLIVYKKGYTPDFVRKAIEEDGLKGMRIFAHLPEERLSSLEFLKDFDFLKRLDISSIVENDYSYNFLSSLQNLQSFSMDVIVLNKKTINPLNLSHLPNLTDLFLEVNRKFIGLEECQKIKCLSLYAYRVTDLSAISCLSNLETLKVANASLKSLNGLQHLKKLKDLEISYCRVLHDVDAINELPNLKSIFFWTCWKIQSLKNLNNLPKLEILKIVDCKQLDSLNFLDNLTKLNEINFCGTDILDGDMSPAKRIAKIAYLHKKHYNIKLDTPEQDAINRHNQEKLKELGLK